MARTLSFGRTPGTLTIDLPKLLVTRALIQGDSGSGKSWLARWVEKVVSYTARASGDAT
ncbi:MAG: hypothetical protein ACREON_17105 [Gemmatimonadaceae bacterium]